MHFRDLLQELNGVKKFRTEPKDSAVEKFKADGGTVSSGAFATVWMHPRWDHVWKTFPHNQAYLQYLDYAAKHPNNPHFPRIFKMKKIVPPYARPSTHPYLWAVKMEKLNPISKENWKMVDAARGLLLGFEFDLTMETFKQKYPEQGMSIMRTIQLLEDGRGRQSPQVNDDLHKSDNFMQRDDGTVVITDPWWTREQWGKQVVKTLAGGTLDVLPGAKPMLAKTNESLAEMIGVKQFKKTGKYDFLQQFVKAGGSYNSDGTFSVILMHPRWDHVWKTFVDDPGYLHYLEMVKANPNNPHYPRIFKVKKIVPPFQRFASQPYLWAVKMEKLLPISGSNWKIVQHCKDVINFAMSQERFNELHPKHGSLLSTIYGLVRNRNGNILDLEERNFMQRLDGTVVMADPLWNKVDKAGGREMLDGGELPPDAFE